MGLSTDLEAQDVIALRIATGESFGPETMMSDCADSDIIGIVFAFFGDRIQVDIDWFVTAIKAQTVNFAGEDFMPEVVLVGPFGAVLKWLSCVGIH